nr:hypothetical protein [Tanacetum cinerariifolium]
AGGRGDAWLMMVVRRLDGDDNDW